MSNKLTALVIDDSAVMRKMVMKSLTETKLAEFEFIEATDGQDGLEKLKANEIAIAFVDWNMPNMTGVDFVREVRKLEKANGTDPIPLVMVTSEKTLGKVEEALDQAGADGFISKPFTVEEMQHKLRKHVETAVMLQIRKVRAKQQAAAPTQPKEAGGWFSKLLS